MIAIIEKAEVSTTSPKVTLETTAKQAVNFTVNNNYIRFWEDVKTQIESNLLRDNPKAYKDSSGTINNIKCPVCGQNEAYFNKDNGLYILCHRDNKCGARTHAKEIYPELFSINFAEKFPATKADPRATAKAYLMTRGLDISIFEFEQGNVYDMETNHNYTTVKILISDNLIFHRLIDYSGKDKNRIYGSYKNIVYEALTEENTTDDVFITEGIFNALSLKQAGFNAIATLSSGTIPYKYLEANKDKTFVIAYDSDKAGRKGTAKLIKFFKHEDIKYKIIFPPENKDWNDLLQETRQLENNFREYEHYGRLFLSEFSNKTEAYYKELCSYHNSEAQRIFLFNAELYRGFIKKTVEGTEHNVFRLLNCNISIKYAIEDINNDDEYTKQIVYRIVLKKQNKTIIRDIQPKVLTQKGLFDEFLFNNQCIFYGSDKDLLALRDYLLSLNIEVIRKLNIWGYDEISKCYVFNSFLIDTKGKLHYLNSDDVFTGLNIAPASKHCRDIINNFEAGNLNNFTDTLYNAFGERGFIIFGFYIASLFAKQISDILDFFPILSIYGDAHTGKSTVTKLFQNCFFFKKEGEAFTKSTTAKAISRMLAKKSNATVMFLEGSKDKYKNPLPENFLLSAFNRVNSYSHAKKSNDFEIMEKPLNSTLGFVQNYEFFTEVQEIQRIISIEFLKEHRTNQSKEAYSELKKYSQPQLASVGLYILKNRLYFENNIINEIEAVNNIFVNAGIDLDRISYNHSICIASLLLFLKLINCSGYEAYKKKVIEYGITQARKKLNFESEQDATTQDIFERVFNDCIHGKDYKIEGDTLFIYRSNCDDKIKYQSYVISNSIAPYRLPAPKNRNADKVYLAIGSGIETKQVRCWRFSIDELIRKFNIDFKEKLTG